MKNLLTLGLLAVFILLVAPNCDEIEEPGAPRNLVLTAVENGLKVKLSWDEPSDGPPDGYLIYFQEVGETTYDSVGSVTTTEFTHDPAGMTGKYMVSAYIGDKEADSEEESTIPISTPAITVAELNAAGESGFGFDITTGNASIWSMTSSESPTYVDFYVTDLAVGSQGTYYIASADIVITADEPDKPPETPTSGWRVNGVLLNPFENATDKILKPGKDWMPTGSEYAGWEAFGESTPYGLTINYDGADLMGNYYYAYIVTGSQSGTNITISTIYFQKIPNLRLLYHQ